MRLMRRSHHGAIGGGIEHRSAAAAAHAPCARDKDRAELLPNWRRTPAQSCQPADAASVARIASPMHEAEPLFAHHVDATRAFRIHGELAGSRHQAAAAPPTCNAASTINAMAHANPTNHARLRRRMLHPQRIHDPVQHAADDEDHRKPRNMGFRQRPPIAPSPRPQRTARTLERFSCAAFARCTFGSVCRASQPRGSRLS
jgi:hypothetical protein